MAFDAKIACFGEVSDVGASSLLLIRNAGYTLGPMRCESGKVRLNRIRAMELWKKVGSSAVMGSCVYELKW